jgi:hypothetical protein
MVKIPIGKITRACYQGIGMVRFNTAFLRNIRRWEVEKTPGR